MSEPDLRDRSAAERPSHPKWQALVLIAVVAFAIIGLGAISTFGAR
jgi:hypothetical protein